MKKIILTLFCLFPLVFSGCGGLDALDLSGEYYLYQQDDYKTESFVLIDSYSWSDSGNLRYLLERNFSSELGVTTLARYWRENWNGLELINYNFNVGGEKYLIGADFYPLHIDLEIRDSNGNHVSGLEYVSSYYHTPYDDLHLDDLSWREQTLTQIGKETYRFIELSSNQPFRLDGEYQAAFRISRDLYIDSETKERKSKRETYLVEFTADLKIAFAQYLSGKKRLKGKNGKEIEINFWIFDRNLDGKFTHDDYLFIEYPSSLFFSSQLTLALGKPVSLDKNSKTLYTITLSPPLSEKKNAPYILNIEKQQN